MSAAQSSGSAPARTTEQWQPGACAGNSKVLGGFLRTVEFEASEAGGHAGTFERLRAGDLQAAIVHGVYPQAVLDCLVERLERHDRRSCRPGSRKNSAPGSSAAI